MRRHARCGLEALYEVPNRFCQLANSVCNVIGEVAHRALRTVDNVVLTDRGTSINVRRGLAARNKYKLRHDQFTYFTSPLNSALPAPWGRSYNPTNPLPDIICRQLPDDQTPWPGHDVPPVLSSSAIWS